jgi:hypothetical protein
LSYLQARLFSFFLLFFVYAYFYCTICRFWQKNVFLFVYGVCGVIWYFLMDAKFRFYSKVLNQSECLGDNVLIQMYTKNWDIIKLRSENQVGYLSSKELSISCR